MLLSRFPKRMKQAYISTKDKAEHSVQPAESSETEYASNKDRKNTAECCCHETAHRADEVGRWGVEKPARMRLKPKDNINNLKKQKRAAQQ